MGSLVHYWWECTMTQSLSNTVSQCLVQLHTHSPYGLTIPFVANSTRQMETYAHTKTCPRMFIAALLTISQNGNPPKCPSMDGWVEKHGSIKTMKYHSAVKTNLTDTPTQMDLWPYEMKNLKRLHLYDFIYTTFLK